MHIFGQKKKPPCNPAKKHLQTLSDARAWRDRFRLNPLAKLASGLFVPQPLRMSPGYPCCCPCDFGCVGCEAYDMEVTFTGFENDACGECEDFNDGPFILSWDTSRFNWAYGCYWSYELPSPICSTTLVWVEHPHVGIPKYRVWISNYPGGPWIRFYKSLAGFNQCCDRVNFSTDAYLYGLTCNATNAIASVRSILAV